MSRFEKVQEPLPSEYNNEIEQTLRSVYGETVDLARDIATGKINIPDNLEDIPEGLAAVAEALGFTEEYDPDDKRRLR